MANRLRLTEREALPGILDAATEAPSEGEGEWLLAAALTAALLEYRRQVQNPGGDAVVAAPAVEWRLLARWEQMTAPVRSRGQGRA
jgi:hypothetical protein